MTVPSENNFANVRPQLNNEFILTKLTNSWQN